MDKQLRKILLFITGGLFFISIIIIIPFVIKDTRSMKWPTTTAVIKKCEVMGKHLEADDPKYYLEIEYEYKAGNQVYKSTKYRSFLDRISSRSELQIMNMKKDYSINSVITIAYDPNNPGFGLIKPGIVWYHIVGLAIVALFGACFVACLLSKERSFSAD